MSAKPRALIIAIEQYDPNGSIPNQLPGTTATAGAFRRWLIEKKKVEPTDIIECVSATYPAPETTKKALLKTLDRIQTDWQNQTSELYVFISGHGLSQDQTGKPADYLITSDFESFSISGDASVAVQEMQWKLRRALGPGEHYYFVDICRTDAPPSQVVLGQLTLVENRSNLGEAAYSTLFSARQGATADVESGFGVALLQGLEGKGRAKQWVQDQLYVTFEALLEYVQERIKPQQIDTDTKGKANRRILVVTPVVNSPCTIDVLGASADDVFEVQVSDVKAHEVLSTTFTGPKYELELRPDDYIIKVLEHGEPLEQVAPPPASALNLFDPCAVQFRKEAVVPAAAYAPPARSTFEIVYPSMASARIVDAVSGDTFDLDGPQARAMRPGRYSIEMLDRGVVADRVTRNLGYAETAVVELGAPKRTPAHDAIRNGLAKAAGQPDADPRLVDFSESLGGPIATQDLTLWLTLLGGARVFGGPDAYHKLQSFALEPFGEVPRWSSPTYVLMGFEGELSSATVDNNGTQRAKLKAIKNLTHVLHGRLETPPGPSLLTLTLPDAQTEITLASHALQNRVTLVVVVHGEDRRWYVRQLILPLAQFVPEMPPPVAEFFFTGAPLRTIHSFAQAQTLFTREHAMREALQPGYWEAMLDAKWLDPVISLMACYELVRGGTFDRAILGTVLTNLREHFPGLADTEAIAKIAGMPYTEPVGTPMFLEGAMTFPGKLEEQRGSKVLDYRAPWTMWIGRTRAPKRRRSAGS